MRMWRYRFQYTISHKLFQAYAYARTHVATGIRCIKKLGNTCNPSQDKLNAKKVTETWSNFLEENHKFRRKDLGLYLTTNSYSFSAPMIKEKKSKTLESTFFKSNPKNVEVAVEFHPGLCKLEEVCDMDSSSLKVTHRSFLGKNISTLIQEGEPTKENWLLFKLCENEDV